MGRDLDAIKTLIINAGTRWTRFFVIFCFFGENIMFFIGGEDKRNG